MRLAGDEKACREAASVCRADLAVFCSDYEVGIVNRKFGVGNEALLTMFYTEEEIERGGRTEGERSDFVWIGHFNHAPNKDSLELLKIVWPLIHAQLPHAELHIYGSFCPPSFSLPLPGIVIKGPAASISVLSTYKVMLVPLRFGAGIKGKITDAWLHGVDVVTTSIGAEGLWREGKFAGWVEDDWEAFARRAVEVYQGGGGGGGLETREVLRRHFSLEGQQAALGKYLGDLRTNLDAVRESRAVQQLLWSQSLRASSYFSKYISLKEGRSTLSYSPASGYWTPV